MPGRGGPSYRRERKLLREGIDVIVGIDEAGVGPWAGPVVAAAVRLEPKKLPRGVDDSKRLTAEQREACFKALARTAVIGVGIAEVERIDAINILRASHWAMREAVQALGLAPAIALVDGRLKPDLGCQCEAIVDGDAMILSISAASIVAKVVRDRIMNERASRYPGYGWERNKGYGTREHRLAIARLGLTPEHRRSFRPIREVEDPEGEEAVE